MAWLVLVASGLLEAVWATALGKSEGFTRPVPVVFFGAGLTLSMAGLAFALRTVPVGTGYAVWVGTGAACTAAYAMLVGDEPVGVLRILFLLGIVGCVIGLRLTA